MADKIFEDSFKNVEFGNKTVLSFKDCPNKCVDGYYVDPYRHKKVRCKYCADLRRKLVKEETSVKGFNLNEKLNLPESFSPYDRDIVLPFFARKYMTEDSVESVLNRLDSLINDISVGNVPDYSMLFNLGASCHENNFVAEYLSRAYMSGLSVSPFYSSHEIIVLRNKSESFSIEMDNFDNLLDCDVCLLYIENGASSESIMATIGVVQLRAYRGKSTIIFTKTPIGKSRLDLNICPESEKCKDLLTYYTVYYNSEEKKNEKANNEQKQKSDNISEPKKMSKDSFNNLIRGKNFL